MTIAPCKLLSSVGARGGQKASRFKSGPDYLEKSVQIFFWSRLKSGFCLEKIHFFLPDSSRLNPDKNLETVWTRSKPDFCLDFNWTNFIMPRQNPGFHGPPNRSDLRKQVPRTAESVRIFKAGSTDR